MEITGEMQVHVLHRHNLRITTTGRAPLHAETGPKRGLADTDCCLFSDRVQPVNQPDCGCGLALTGRRRVYRGHKDQLAVLAVRLRRNELGRQFGLVVTKRDQILSRDTKLGPNILNGTLACRARNFDIC